MLTLDDEARRTWLGLVGCGLEPATLTRLLAAFPSPQTLLHASERELREDHQVDGRQFKLLHRLLPPKTMDAQLRALDQHGIDIVPLGHPDYPENLFRLRVPPPALFVKGRLDATDTLAVGIVGPRNPTAYGIDVTRSLARDFAPNLTVVSGAAMGIDSVAHETVINAGGRTLAVLGCGIDVNYPAANEALRRRIGDGTRGAIISTFAPGEQPLRHHFPIRNFVLAGLCLAVIVVEASDRSGALVTARAAGEEGRLVYAVPGDINRRNSAGSNALLRDGATVCTSAADVLADLESTLRQELLHLREKRQGHQQASRDQPQADATATFADTPEESVILTQIQHDPISHDDLIDRFVPGRMDLGTLASALLALELKGRIQQMPGRRYAAKL